MNPTNGDDDEEGTESGSTWTGCSTDIFFSTNYNHATWWPGKKRNSTFTLEAEAETFLSIETKKNWKKNQRPIPTETKTLPQILLSQVST